MDASLRLLRARREPGRLLDRRDAVAAAAGTILASAILRARRGEARLALLAAACGSAAFLIAQRGDRRPRRRNARTRDVPNVLLVIVDVMRRDVLGCYGNTRVQTPHIDRLAKEGVARTRSRRLWTWPSFGSILTGSTGGATGS